jgi:predicted ArsR family transcriptional regulator
VILRSDGWTGRESRANAHDAVMASSGSMLPDERRRLIAERLLKRGSVSVSALEAEFEISPMTVRRDLDELER